MRHILRPSIRVLLALIVTAFVMGYGRASQPVISGRDFSRCMGACGERGRVCQDRCRADCAFLFEDQATQSECFQQCDAYCVIVTMDCRSTCNSLHFTWPDEP
jgi:hypothetical protein